MSECFFRCGVPLWGRKDKQERVMYVPGRGWCHRFCFKIDKARGFPFRMEDETPLDKSGTVGDVRASEVNGK